MYKNEALYCLFFPVSKGEGGRGEGAQSQVNTSTDDENQSSKHQRSADQWLSKSTKICLSTEQKAI